MQECLPEDVNYLIQMTVECARKQERNVSDTKGFRDLKLNHYAYHGEGGSFPSPKQHDAGRYRFKDLQIEQHPWLNNLKVMAEWLESSTPLPHGELAHKDLPYKGSQANSNKAWYRAEPTIFFRSTCEHCILMFKLRFEYQNNYDHTGTHQSST